MSVFQDDQRKEMAALMSNALRQYVTVALLTDEAIDVIKRHKTMTADARAEMVRVIMDKISNQLPDAWLAAMREIKMAVDGVKETRSNMKNGGDA